jgi:formiminotetrahydrofolate cyclodeaminase
MERNFDEVIADMLIQLANIEARREAEDRRMEAFDERMRAFDKRLELTIKRMVKIETRLDQGKKRMELFDERLKQSIESQNEINKYFLDYIKKNPIK